MGADPSGLFPFLCVGEEGEKRYAEGQRSLRAQRREDWDEGEERGGEGLVLFYSGAMA